MLSAPSDNFIQDIVASGLNTVKEVVHGLTNVLKNPLQGLNGHGLNKPFSNIPEIKPENLLPISSSDIPSIDNLPGLQQPLLRSAMEETAKTLRRLKEESVPTQMYRSAIDEAQPVYRSAIDDAQPVYRSAMSKGLRYEPNFGEAKLALVFKDENCVPSYFKISSED